MNPLNSKNEHQLALIVTCVPGAVIGNPIWVYSFAYRHRGGHTGRDMVRCLVAKCSSVLAVASVRRRHCGLMFYAVRLCRL